MSVNSIYKPTGGKRLSRKRIYKVSNNNKMSGGGFFGELFGGEEPKPVDGAPVDGAPVDSVPVDSAPVTDGAPVTDSVPTPEPTVDTPPVNTPEIDGEGNPTSLDNTIPSSEDNNEKPGILDNAVTAAKSMGSMMTESAQNTMDDLTNTPDNDTTEGYESDDNAESVDESESDGAESSPGMNNMDYNELISIISDQNNTIKEQSAKIERLLEGQIEQLTINSNQSSPPLTPSPNEPNLVTPSPTGTTSSILTPSPHFDSSISPIPVVENSGITPLESNSISPESDINVVSPSQLEFNSSSQESDINVVSPSPTSTPQSLPSRLPGGKKSTYRKTHRVTKRKSNH